MKTCTKCGQAKQITEFRKDARKRSGLGSHCKTCVASAYATYRSTNPEKVKASQAAYYSSHRDKVKAKDAAYYAANREKVAAKNAAWNALNKGKKAALHADWYKANSDKAKAYNAAWRAVHPDANRIHKANRNKRVKSSGGRLSAGLSAKLLKLQRGKCACGCGQKLGDDYHLDHIMPLALGGSNTDDNIQLLRAECNLQKSAKHPVDFMQKRGFLL